MNSQLLLASVALTFLLFSSELHGQDSQRDELTQEIVVPQKSPRHISRLIRIVQRYSDSIRQELLLVTSFRDLRFRCGRYWVDNYSNLITSDDREVGIWGVDGPSSFNMQMRRK